MATFLDLTDVATPAIANGYLRWDATATEIIYETTISTANITGLAGVASDGKLTTLVDTDPASIANGYLRWDPLGNVVEYQTTIPSTAITGFSVVATTGDYSDLINTPSLSTVATTGEYSDLLNIIPDDWTDITSKPTSFTPAAHVHDIIDIADLQTELDGKADSNILVGYTVDYDTQVTNKPDIPVDSDFSLIGLSDTSGIAVNDGFLKWNTVGTQVIYETSIDSSFISGLATVATSGSYNDLNDTPLLATVAITGDYSDLINKPDLSVYALITSLADVATSGSYNDLLDVPTLFSGDYGDLINVPAEFTPAAHTHVEADITDLSVPSVLDDLDDVDVSTATNNDVLRFNSTAGEWEASGLSNITDLDDVNSVPVSNGYLRWSTDASEVLFETNIAASSITGLAPVALSGTVEDLNDVIITSILDGQVLEYETSSSTWINVTPSSGGSVALEDLTDVNITALAVDEFLQYDGIEWVNVTSPLSGDIIENGAGTTFADASGLDLLLESSTDIFLTPTGGFIRMAGEVTSSTNLELSASVDVVLQGMKWPNLPGTAGYVLQTDGVDQTAWAISTNLYTADGTLTSATRIITGETASSVAFNLYDTDVSNYTALGTIDIDPANVVIRHTVGDGAGGVTSIMDLDLSSVGAIFTDTTNNKGIEYAADYSGAFTAFSLVDKGYVDSVAGVSSVNTGTNITVDNGDPANPIINLDAAITGTSVNGVTLSGAGAATSYLDETGSYSTPIGSGQVDSVASGTNITIDAGDPANPIANLDAAITGTSVNGVTLSDAGAATDYLDETGAYSTPDTLYSADGTLDAISRTVTGDNAATLDIVVYDLTSADYLTSSNISLDSTSASLIYDDGNGAGGSDGVISLTVGSAGGIVTDTLNSKGIEYTADYASNYTARSIVDKNYVDNPDSISATDSINGGAAVFSASTNTGAIGNVKSHYLCDDTTAIRTLTISSATFALATETKPFQVNITDISGGAGTNNITIATEGGQTISGSATVAITSNYGSYTLLITDTAAYIIGSV